MQETNLPHHVVFNILNQCKPITFLDCRDSQEFDKNRIRGSISFSLTTEVELQLKNSLKRVYLNRSLTLVLVTDNSTSTEEFSSVLEQIQKKISTEIDGTSEQIPPPPLETEISIKVDNDAVTAEESSPKKPPTQSDESEKQQSVALSGNATSVIRGLKDLKQQQIDNGLAEVEEADVNPEPVDISASIQGSAASVVRALKQHNQPVWIQLRSVSGLDFPSFFATYQNCATLFEGSDVASAGLHKGTVKYYPTEIVPGFLYLGDYRDGSDEVVLGGLGITHVVDVTGEQTSQAMAEKLGIAYLPVDIWDMPGVDIAAHFSAVLGFIKAASSTAEKVAKVLVHCRAGISRSATFILAYLMEARLVDSLEQAYRLVLEQRPFVCPNVSFREQLREFEAATLQKSSFANDEDTMRFMSTLSSLWSGLFTTETDHDRVPILAGRNPNGKPVYTMDDAYPGAKEEGEQGITQSAKPKKAFLKRGEGKKAASASKVATSDGSDTTTADTATGGPVLDGPDLTVAGVAVKETNEDTAANDTGNSDADTAPVSKKPWQRAAGGGSGESVVVQAPTEVSVEVLVSASRQPRPEAVSEDAHPAGLVEEAAPVSE